MGGLNSCCIRQQTCDCDMATNSSTPKQKGHRRNLSAVFNLSVIDDGSAGNSLVNINAATEEELMTLPGINRAVAKNIVDYRNHIGGFRCAEDVALASGVGAATLAMIRSDIYVVPPAVDELHKVSRESLHPSLNTESEPSLEISVNTANIFTLLRVKGIGMTIAKNIVAYRDKHGKFKTLDDLLRIKGIGPGNLEVMRPYLTVDDKTKNTSQPSGPNNHSHSNGGIGHNAGNQMCFDPKHEYIKRSTASLENLLEILGPLAKVPERPKVSKVVLRHKNRRVFKMASWNLQRFSQEKASNPGVKDVVCMTILENGLGLVAVQEVADREALEEICQELNSPTLPNVKKWSGRRGQWTSVVSEATGRMFQGMAYKGFLYDRSQHIEFVKSCLLEKAPGRTKPFTRMPFLGIFKIRNAFDFVVVNVHLKATGLEDEDRDRTAQEANKIEELVQAVKKEIKGEKDIVLIGDFNLNPDDKAFDALRAEGYKNCISGDTFTNISNNNVMGSMSYDNIWINKATQKVYTGVSRVIKEGLSSNWIPNEWTWGGVVSDHCPVYAQLYCSPDLDNGNIHADVKFTLGDTTGERNPPLNNNPS